MAAIWEGMAGKHCITIFEMPSPHDRSGSINVTTVNNIAHYYNKKLDTLKLQLQFGLVNVSGGEC